MGEDHLSASIISTIELLEKRDSGSTEVLGAISLLPRGMSTEDLAYLYGEEWPSKVNSLLVLRCVTEINDRWNYFITHSLVADCVVRYLKPDTVRHLVKKLFP